MLKLCWKVNNEGKKKFKWKNISRRIGSREVTGYYFINPDKTLQNTEEQMVKFLAERFPTWKGTVGAIKTTEEITNAVTKYDIFL